uniref:Uncharacterized protein n=1 Tax=Rhizophora mucronata TaxID=61149 RepID=A0A2P2QTW5_RHIMU
MSELNEETIKSIWGCCSVSLSFLLHKKGGLEFFVCK